MQIVNDYDTYFSIEIESYLEKSKYYFQPLLQMALFIHSTNQRIVKDTSTVWCIQKLSR